MLDNWLPYLMVLALIGLIVRMVRGIAEGRESTSWPTVPGRIVESRVEKETSWERVDERDGAERRRRKVSWIPQLTYEYEVNGQRYTGHHASIFRMRHGTQQSAENVVGRYPEGSETTVYYNPKRPEQAVLQPGVPGRSKSVLFLYVVLLGLVLLSILTGGFSA